jgi:outer membrane receptor protein involved in Fe transport
MAAASPAAGSISGIVVDQATGHPVGGATLRLRRPPGGAIIERGASDPGGRFEFDGLPAGGYSLDYAVVGGEAQASVTFTVAGDGRRLDLGRLALPTDSVVRLEKMEVTARREAFYNSIDRKVYVVGHDVQSAAGSATGLLQNIPSVQVDVEGNVSLRGNSNVLILVDGKPSSLMSTANRADVLEQMPADTIERVEVITNPSAKYKPDGTAGIINLVLKQAHSAGFSGTIRVNAGNASRGNASLSANYNPGPYNLFGMISVRQDDRLRYSAESRRHTDATSGALITTEQGSTEHMRPLSRLLQLGGDYPLNPENKLHASASYNYLSFFRTSTVANLARSVDGPVTLDYDRLRTDPEWHKTFEVDARLQHSFADPGHELDLEVKHERHQELEDNHYQNVFRVPVQPGEQDYTLMNPTETTNEVTADYTRPYANGGKFEAGYAGDADIYDTDFRGGFYVPATASWQVDGTQTNRFIYKDWIDAVYATYGRPVGRFGFLAGLRAERTLVHTNQATVRLTGRIEYYRLHPTLHLNWNLTDTSQLQLNYSHRVHRPESDDLNPFPEYQDPYNLRAGNPKLRPEETHSIEAGYQYHRDDTTYLAGLYYRDTYHAFTTVTQYIDTVTLLTTHENLASNQSGGLELVAATPLGPRLNVNLSSNAFYSQINASNLGFSGNRSTVAWDAKANVEWRPTKADLIQLVVNYSARRLTAQGYRLPTYYANIGLRHEFARPNLAFVLTVSDLFNSLKERTIIDTPALYDDLTRRRSSRIVYAGFYYTFGAAAKKPKELDFDSSL